MEKIMVDEIPLSSNHKRDFLRLIDQFPAATKEENVELKRNAELYGLEAKKTMFYRNLRLLRYTFNVIKYRTTLNEEMDLIQVGALALWNSIDTFDPEKASFSRYARRKIFSAVRRHVLETEQAIYRPINFQEHLIAYMKIVAECKKVGTEIPDDEEFRQMLGVSKREFNQLQFDYLLNPISLDRSWEDIPSLNDETLMNDIEVPDKTQDRITFKEILTAIKLSLSPYEYFIVYEHCVEGVPSSDIARIFHNERQAVNRKLNSCLKKIRSWFDKDKNLTISLSILSSGHRIKNIRLTPVEPDDITACLFLKDKISENDYALLIEYVWSDDDARQLPPKLKDAIELLLLSLQKEYMEFHNMMMTKEKSKIYSDKFRIVQNAPKAL